MVQATQVIQNAASQMQTLQEDIVAPEPQQEQPQQSPRLQQQQQQESQSIVTTNEQQPLTPVQPLTLESLKISPLLKEPTTGESGKYMFIPEKMIQSVLDFLLDNGCEVFTEDIK